MANKIVLIGGGGHCKSILDTLNSSFDYEDIFISDPRLKLGTEINGAIVAGGDEVLPELLNQGVKYAFVTIGSVGNRESIELRRDLYCKAKALGYQIPNVIDRTAIVSESAKLSEGIFIGKRAVVNADVDLGTMAIINTGAIVEHECVVGGFSHISIGVVLAGGVNIGDNTFIGAGTTVIQDLYIGKNSVIGAGALVNKCVPDNCKAVGIPVRIIKQM